MKDNYAFDSLNYLLNTNQGGKSKIFETLMPKENDQFTNYSPFFEKDPNETISESEEERDSNNEESQAQYTFDSDNQKNTKEKMEQGRWTNNEHRLFLEGLIKYGNEWKMVQKHIKSRSSTQARSHAQKFFIRIKKNISNEKNPETIKRKIHQIFREEMQDEFNPDNLSLFLDKIMKLVFVSESNSKKHNQFKDHQDESNNNDESSSSSIELESHNNKNLTFKLSDQDDFLNLHERKRSIKSRKESFFSIEKDMDKINIKQLKTKLDKKPEVNNMSNMPNKSYYENYTQTIQQNGNPSCINIVNITMVNNSTNTYVQNYNSNNSNVNDENPKKKCPTINDYNSNPFNLQFDELLFQPSSMNNCICNYNHYDCHTNTNYQEDEHLYANFDL